MQQQLHHGSRRPGGQYKRYKDCLKSTMNRCGIAPSEFEALVMDSSRKVQNTMHSGVGSLNGIYAGVVHHPPATLSARSATGLSFTNRASCPQQVPLVMMRPVVSTAQSMTDAELDYMSQLHSN